MAFEQIRYEVAEGIATITLNRPEKLNAVTSALIQELIAAFESADGDDAVRVVIVTGAGRAFCAGADLSAGTQTFDGARRGRPQADGEHRDGGGLVALRIYDLKKPVIAAINGPAVGFGITMTLPMDIRIASSAARMGFVFARRGVVPEACSTWLLPRLVGMQRAAEWVYTGRVFDAAEALAGEIADHTSGVSVALARQMMWKLLGADHPMEGHRLDSRGMDWTGRSADAREGIASFLEKRPPRFPLTPSRDMPPYYPWWIERSFR